jgi:ABC-2 type transport system ATP-binding protein
LIEVSGVTKFFGTFAAVRDLTFSVARGEVLGFLGPNGAGKTTTMRILTGFVPPTLGTAVVSGHDILREPLEAKRRIGYLPETPPIYPEMTVEGYLDFVARIKTSGLSSRERRDKVSETLERTALSDVRDGLAGKLSKGYRQRLGLAQALVHDPDVLVLDEPTAGLDPKQINETRELIRSLGGDHTVVLSTHILPEVAMTCDRIVIINRGRVVAQGTAESLTEKFHQADVLELAVEGPEEDVRRVAHAIEGIERCEPSRRDGDAVTYRVETREGSDVRRELSERIVEAGLGLLGLKREGMTLEEVYLRVVTSEDHLESLADSEHLERAESGEGLP